MASSLLTPLPGIVSHLLRPGGEIYFRMLVKRGVNGRMALGAGENRYIEIEVSVQSVAGNTFAKR